MKKINSNHIGFISLLLAIPIVLIIYLVSFEINIYIYFFLTSIITLSIFTKHNIKGWYWLSILLIIYSFPHFFNYHFFDQSPVIKNEAFKSIMNDSNYNLEAIKLLSSFIICLYCGSALFNLINFRLPIHNQPVTYKEDIQSNLIGRIFIYVILGFLLYSSFESIDFELQKTSYDLHGFRLLFAACLILNFLILCFFFNNKFKIKYFVLIILLYSLTLGFFGVRQVFFWLYISLLISYFFKSHIEQKKINWFLILFLLFTSILVFGFILGFRNEKEFSFDIISRLWDLSIYGITAETSFTFYNMMASIKLSYITDFFFMKEFKDIIIYLIPYPIFPNKYEFMTLIQFANDYNLKPYGTYFILGELKLSLRHDILVHLFAFLVGFIMEFFLFSVLKKKSNLLAVLYISFITMVLIYSVRNTIPAGIKTFISYNLLIYLIIKYKIVFNTKLN